MCIRDRYISAYSVELRAPGSSIFNRSDVTIRDLDIQHLKFMKDTHLIHQIEHAKLNLTNKQAPQLEIAFQKPKGLIINIGLDGVHDYKIKKNSPFSIHWQDGNILNGYIIGGQFITGTGSLTKPAFGMTRGNIECFFGEIAVSKKGINISKLWVKHCLLYTSPSPRDS